MQGRSNRILMVLGALALCLALSAPSSAATGTRKATTKSKMMFERRAKGIGTRARTVKLRPGQQLKLWTPGVLPLKALGGGWFGNVDLATVHATKKGYVTTITEPGRYAVAGASGTNVRYVDVEIKKPATVTMFERPGKVGTRTREVVLGPGQQLKLWTPGVLPLKALGGGCFGNVDLATVRTTKKGNDVTTITKPGRYAVTGGPFGMNVRYIDVKFK